MTFTDGTINALATPKKPCTKAGKGADRGIRLRLSATSKLKTWQLHYSLPPKQGETTNPQPRVFQFGHWATDGTGIDVATMRQLVIEYRKMIARGVDPKIGIKLQKENTNVGTIKQLINSYLLYKNHLATIKAQKSQLNTFFKDYMDIPANMYTRSDIRSVMKPLLNAEKHAMAVKYRTVVSALFNYAIKFHDDSPHKDAPDVAFNITENPMHEYPILKAGEKPVFSCDRNLTESELIYLFQESELEEKSKLKLKLLLMTGQRPSMILRTSIDHINFKKRIMLWSAEEMKKGKNKKKHQIPLNDFQINLFKLAIEKYSNKNTDFIFPGRFGTGCETIGTLEKSLKKFITKDKNIEPFTMYDMRRTFASRILEINPNPYLIDFIQARQIKSIGEKHYFNANLDEHTSLIFDQWCETLDRIFNPISSKLTDHFDIALQGAINATNVN